MITKNQAAQVYAIMPCACPMADYFASTMRPILQSLGGGLPYTQLSQVRAGWSAAESTLTCAVCHDQEPSVLLVLMTECNMYSISRLCCEQRAQ